MKGATLTVCMLMIQVFCFLLPCQAGTAGAGEKGQKQTQADYAHLAGKWVRLDGGYVMELKDVTPNGRLKALYFNPRPINVSRAGWRRTANGLEVLVELRDVNYPGSTYKLAYSAEKDLLEGYYYQALHGQTYYIEFVRVK
jgi:hypothetical protein